MRSLVERAGWRHFHRHPWQAALAVLGVALGLAVVVSIELAGRSALVAFGLSSDALAGGAAHQIVGGADGVPELLYRRLRVEEGLRDIAPIVEGYVTIADTPEVTLRLFGVDPFAESGMRGFLAQGAEADFERLLRTPGGVALAPQTAVALGLEPGETFDVEVAGVRTTLELVGRLEPRSELERAAGGDLALCDIATAQEVLGMEGRLSRIDVARTDAVFSDSPPTLPAGVHLTAVPAGGAAAAEMTRGFRLNLRALSLLAFLCGAFLIYNTITFSVVQRRPMLGTLRALGVTRSEVLRMVLVESALIGIFGSVAGIAGGVFLARQLLRFVTRTINDLYFVTNVREVELSAPILALGLLLGVGTSLLAALPPALEAMATVPRAALDRSALEGRVHRAVPRAALGGVLLAAIGIVLLLVPGKSLAAAFLGLFLILLGLGLLTPAGTIGLMRILTPLSGVAFGIPGRMAARGVTAGLSRTAVAITALTMAVAVTVGVDLMIASFRGTVERWLAYSLPADLYVAPATAAARLPGTPGSFRRVTVEAIARLPGIERVNTVRSTRVPIGGTTTDLVAFDFGSRGREAFAFERQAKDDDQVWAAFERQAGVLVSEPLSVHRGTRPGDLIEIEGSREAMRLPVLAVYFDYASEHGAIMVHRRLYERLWLDDTVSAMSIDLASGADAAEVAASIRSAVGPRQRIQVRTNRALRQASLAVFDRTFAITGVLRTLAVVVAFIAVLSALTALELERAREIAVLRAAGMTPAQVWRLITAQTGLMGLAAGLLALPSGLAMAVIMVYVINRRSFGWSLELALPVETLLTAVALALIASLAAGIYPAWSMSRTPPAAALRGE